MIPPCHRIRSTRKLEAACSENLSLVWLTGLIAPDHNSLWRFWRDNKKALRTIFKQTVQVAVRTGAVGLALQALDGTKIQAGASTPAGWSKEYMEKLLAQLDGGVPFDRSDEVLDIVRLSDRSGDKVGGFSSGMVSRSVRRASPTASAAGCPISSRGTRSRRSAEPRR